MSVRTKGALITWTTGDREAAPIVLLHDRYRDHDANDALGARLAPTHRVVSVRGARTQMEMGLIKGYYWHLGPLTEPELSTLGDALSHLELLLIALNRETNKRIAIIGTGEGGSVALLIGLLWPELIAGVASIDGPLAQNIADMPLELPPAAGLPVLLAQRDADLSRTAADLSARGTTVTAIAASDDAVAAWLHRLA